MAPIIPSTGPGRLVVVGQGYVGLPLAIRAVEVGWHVVGVDLDADRVRRLAAADSFVEDVSDDDLRAALATGRYLPTADYGPCAEFDVAVITVPTPLREGNPDLSHVEGASRSLAPLVRAGCTVVLESTTYPGTTEGLVGPLLAAGSSLTPGADFHLGYSPERIDPGNAHYDFRTTPKIVSGVDPASAKAVQGFFDTIVDTTVPVSGCREAELTKLLENTFRHVNIALVNEMAMFAHELGIDIWETIDAAATKPFGFMRFTPGPGVGGHCLPIDPSYLSWQVKQALGRPFRFVELANDVNDAMPDYVVRRVAALLNEQRKAVNGARILLLGLAYKRNSSDGRESPAPAVARRLVALGAEVRAADPHVEHPAPEGVGTAQVTTEELEAADLVVVLTDHDAFPWDLVAATSTPVLDTRRVAGLEGTRRL